MTKNEAELRERIEDEFFKNSRSIHVSWGVEGNQIDHDHSVVIGGRAGPVDSCHISNLAHEMAHFVEIDDRRCGMYGWGLRYSMVEIFGQRCASPFTRQGTERELRVIAYQANLLEYLGVEFVTRAPEASWNSLAPNTFELNDTVKSLSFLADYLYIPISKHAPYGMKDPLRQEWRMKRLAQLRKQQRFQVRNFIPEWWRKEEILWRRMQRKQRSPRPIAPYKRILSVNL